MTPARWMETVGRPLLTCLMLGCVTLSVFTAAGAFVGGWDPTYLIVFCIATALEAHFSLAALKRMPAGSRTVQLRIGEIAALFLALQLCIDWATGRAPIADNMPQFDFQSLILFLPVLLTWSVATSIASDFRRLGGPPEQDPRDVAPIRRLATRFFWGGIFLFIITGLAQPSMEDRLHVPQPTVRAPVLSVLIYFLAGIVLLGQVRYATLMQRWRTRDIIVATGLGSRWLRYSVLFVGMVIVLALLLPTTRTIGLVEVGRAAWNLLFTILWGPLLQLLSHFKGAAPHIRPREIPTILPHLPPLRHSPIVHHRGSSGGSPPLKVLQSILFWLVVAVGALYLLYNVVQRRPQGFGKLTESLGAALTLLQSLWKGFLRLLIGYTHAIAARMPQVNVRGLQSPPLPGLFWRRGARSPRQKVLDYYLNIVHRARRHGFSRRSSQTPREFTAGLGSRLPDAQDDMYSLTEAFIHAKYSRRQVDETEVGRLRVHWMRVRDAIRTMRL